MMSVRRFAGAGMMILTALVLPQILGCGGKAGMSGESAVADELSETAEGAETSEASQTAEEQTFETSPQTDTAGRAGAFVDGRDGQEYRTVTIGGQTWMAQNLNFHAANSWCYDNGDASCAAFGRLYTWRAAMLACPDGWRLPEVTDWDTLITAAGGADAGGRALKSRGGWHNRGNGSDALGFGGQPAGFRVDGEFQFISFTTFWWSAGERDEEGAWGRGLVADSREVIVGWNRKTDAFSVRCIMENAIDDVADDVVDDAE